MRAFFEGTGGQALPAGGGALQGWTGLGLLGWVGVVRRGVVLRNAGGIW